MKTRYTAWDLKKIAIVTMTIDHAAISFLYWTGLWETPCGNGIYSAMRLIGRMAFPLYAFLIVQGFLHTKDVRHYQIRLAVLALASELPFNLLAGHSFFYPQRQNIGFLYLTAVLCMEILERKPDMLPAGKLAVILSACAAAFVLRADYGAEGLIFILILYFFRDDPLRRMWAGCIMLILMYRTDSGLASCIAFFFINRYNGEKGKGRGYLPYAVYPLHMLLLAALGELFYELYF